MPVSFENFSNVGYFFVFSSKSRYNGQLPQRTVFLSPAEDDEPPPPHAASNPAALKPPAPASTPRRETIAPKTDFASGESELSFDILIYSLRVKHKLVVGLPSLKLSVGSGLIEQMRTGGNTTPQD